MGWCRGPRQGPSPRSATSSPCKRKRLHRQHLWGAVPHRRPRRGTTVRNGKGKRHRGPSRRDRRRTPSGPDGVSAARPLGRTWPLCFRQQLTGVEAREEGGQALKRVTEPAVLLALSFPSWKALEASTHKRKLLLRHVCTRRSAPRQPERADAVRACRVRLPCGPICVQSEPVTCQAPGSEDCPAHVASPGWLCPGAGRRDAPGPRAVGWADVLKRDEVGGERALDPCQSQRTGDGTPRPRGRFSTSQSRRWEPPGPLLWAGDAVGSVTDRRLRSRWEWPAPCHVMTCPPSSPPQKAPARSGVQRSGGKPAPREFHLYS